MDNIKEIRWRQRFENYEKSIKVIEKYVHTPIDDELERAGLFQLFQVSFELAWKVMKDYLGAEEIIVKSPREEIKEAFKLELISDGHIWLDALSDRNLAVHTYDEDVMKEMVDNIVNKYYPQMESFYKLLKGRV